MIRVIKNELREREKRENTRSSWQSLQEVLKRRRARRTGTRTIELPPTMSLLLSFLFHCI